MRRVWKRLHDRHIFFRHFVIVERGTGKERGMTGLNIEKSEFIARRVKNIDGILEGKLKKAILNMDFYPPFDIEEAKSRLKHDYVFIILEYNDEIIGWSWAAIGSVYIPEMEMHVDLGDKVAFSFNTYVDKHYRKKGLNRIILRKKLEMLNLERFAKIWGLIYRWNLASVRSFTEAGWNVTGRYYYLKIFFIKIRHKSSIK